MSAVAPRPDPTADPGFPALHIRPPQGWLNDPNGVCRIDGRYHVFFQYNPDGPVHANVHWGHVSSADLLRWEAEPVALAPRPGTVDGGGCWSGCVVDDGGVPTAVYTGVRRHAWESGVVLARSDRTLRDWVQDEDYQVAIPDHPEITEVRDPYIFTFQGRRYAVQGAGRIEGPPRILLYGCDDLTAWTELGDLLTSEDPEAARIAPAQIWECPNLFPLGDRWVLLLSLWRHVNGTYALSGVRYLMGDLRPEGEGLRFVTSSGGSLDDGPTFYAPQVLLDEGRALLWGWAWEAPERTSQTAQTGWAGVLTFPRELVLEGDQLRSRPAAELTRLRGEELDAAAVAQARSFEVVTTGPARLELAPTSTAAGEAELVVDVEGPARILVDGSVVEVFPAQGPAGTWRAYPSAGTRWVVRSDAATVYQLRA